MNEKCYDRPAFAMYASFPFKDFLSFISMKNMLVNRHRLAGYLKDSDMNESVTSSKSAALALFTWYSSTKPSRILGALFDLNMFYTKRLPTRLTTDNTIFSQMYCVSGFETDISVDIEGMEIYVGVSL